MLGLDKDQRRVLADKLADLANLAAGAMVIGVVVGDHAFSWMLLLAGAIAWTVLMAGSLFAAKGRRS